MASSNNDLFWATVRYLESMAASTREMAIEGAIGLLCGMQIAFQHPEYAQAYIELMAQCEESRFTNEEINVMIEAIPITTQGED